MTAKQAVRFSIFTIDEEVEETQGNQIPTEQNMEMEVNENDEFDQL